MSERECVWRIVSRNKKPPIYQCLICRAKAKTTAVCKSSFLKDAKERLDALPEGFTDWVGEMEPLKDE